MFFSSVHQNLKKEVMIMHALEIFTIFSLVMMISIVAEGAAVSGKCDIIILVANTNHIFEPNSDCYY